MLIKLLTLSLITICINFKEKTRNLQCSNSPISDDLRANNHRLMSLAWCCVECASQKFNKVEKCLDGCKRSSSGNLNFKNIMSTESLKLLCRDDRRMVLTSNAQNADLNESNIYIVKIAQYSRDSSDDVEFFVSNTSTFILPDLIPDTKYNISLASINKRLEYAIIANNEVFSTFRQNVKPKQIEKQNIKVSGFKADSEDLEHITATVKWSPSDDMCYFYELIWHSETDTMSLPNVHQVNDLRKEYSHILTPLEMGSSYVIGIRTKIATNNNRESNITWIEPIMTPQCMVIHKNNSRICPPYQPTDLNIAELPDNGKYRQLNVSWKTTLPAPQYFILKFLTFSQYFSPPEVFNISGNSTYFVIENINVNSSLFEVRLTAVNPGGNVTIGSSQLHFDPRIVHHKISWIVKAIVICLLLISFILITWIILYRKPHIEKMKKYCGHESFIMSDQIKDPKNFIEFTCHFDDVEIPLENIKIEDEELGAGAFGIVKRCIYKDKECNFRHAAVKMLKLNPSVDEIKAFHREISMMKAVGRHENIVSIIGHCTKTCDHLYLLTEYCAKGSLLDFLRNAKSGIMDKFTAFNANYMTPLQGYELLNIAKQVALGMQFLASSKIVHRDLAARNVLVCDDLTVKIADFGLSRDIYKDNIYKIVDRSKLPIKWYALESITYSFYTTQSDVWSFGILLYEIVTYGNEPYEGFIVTNNFVNYLKEGNRMKKPANCGQRLYNLMYSCWYENPDERPTFDLIVEILDDFVTRTPNEHILDKIIDVDGYMKPID